MSVPFYTNDYGSLLSLITYSLDLDPKLASIILAFLLHVIAIGVSSGPGAHISGMVASSSSRLLHFFIVVLPRTLSVS